MILSGPSRREHKIGAMGKGLSYPEGLIDRLEVFWGVGFLSPGGREEVREILRNVRIQNKSVLDIGCGIAGPAIVIARDLGAKNVVGIDIEPQVIARAARNVSEAGLQNRVDLKLVEPGPLPFADASFDIVFSKDALIHIEDKPAFYNEIVRVLKPDGTFAASDWLASEDSGELPEFIDWIEMSPHDFAMQTMAQAEAVMCEAGFVDVTARDRNAWYVDLSLIELERMEGPLRERFLEVCEEEAYQQIVKVRRANAAAARCGGLRPTHLRGAGPTA